MSAPCLGTPLRVPCWLELVCRHDCSSGPRAMGTQRANFVPRVFLSLFLEGNESRPRCVDAAMGALYGPRPLPPCASAQQLPPSVFPLDRHVRPLTLLCLPQVEEVLQELRVHLAREQRVAANQAQLEAALRAAELPGYYEMEQTPVLVAVVGDLAGLDTPELVRERVAGCSDLPPE